MRRASKDVKADEEVGWLLSTRVFQLTAWLLLAGLTRVLLIPKAPGWEVAAREAVALAPVRHSILFLD